MNAEESNRKNSNSGDSNSEEIRAGPSTNNKIQMFRSIVGIEMIRKIKAYFCETCGTFLLKLKENELEATIARHCQSTSHVQRYRKFKETKSLIENCIRKLKIAEMQNKQKQEENNIENKLVMDEGHQDILDDEFGEICQNILKGLPLTQEIAQNMGTRDSVEIAEKSERY